MKKISLLLRMSILVSSILILSILIFSVSAVIAANGIEIFPSDFSGPYCGINSIYGAIATPMYAPYYWHGDSSLSKTSQAMCADLSTESDICFWGGYSNVSYVEIQPGGFQNCYSYPAFNSDSAPTFRSYSALKSVTCVNYFSGPTSNAVATPMYEPYNRTHDSSLPNMLQYMCADSSTEDMSCQLLFGKGSIFSFDTDGSTVNDGCYSYPNVNSADNHPALKYMPSIKNLVCAQSCLPIPACPPASVGTISAGCRAGVRNATVTNNFCPSDSCFSCNSGYVWNGASCVTKCGDGIVESANDEQCDNGSLNTDVPVYGSGAYCTSSCQIKTASYCGDGNCDIGYENYSSCSQDCGWNIDGWYTLKGNPGWSISGGKLLVSSANKVLYSDPFDIEANTSYNLSAVVQSNGCQVTISLDSECTSAVDWKNKSCDLSVSSVSLPFSSTSSQSNSIIFSENDNINAANTGQEGAYFKNVRLIIKSSSCSSGATANISHISLKNVNAVTNNVHYDTLPMPISEFSGCCPSNYCWNGTVCVDSNLWMSNATYGPVWNKIFDASLLNNHVNTVDQPYATGYRCMITNSTANGAEWVSSSIKYDWNYEHSGYCLLPTDCFVNNSNIDGLPNGGAGYSTGCIHNGSIISDDYSFGVGNHYCYQGNWTTKSYIIATELQTLSKGNSFILTCSNDSSVLYNTIKLDSTPIDILSACTIIVKSGSNTEQVITGAALGEGTNLKTFMQNAYNEYSSSGLSGLSKINVPSSENNLLACTSYTSGFVKCADADNLKIYYNQKYNYVLISDKILSTVETGTFSIDSIFSAVKTFFNKMFNVPAVYRAAAYNSINYTSSYDKIYVLSNNTLNVRGIEESKYDESLGNVTTLLYVYYGGANSSNDLLNITDIQNTVSGISTSQASVADKYSAVSATLNNGSYQEIIIKTNNPTGLWQYFTTTLRDR